MFHDLDTTIENILNDAAAPAELYAAGVSFETPVRTFTPQNPDSAINLFLYEVKENRKLRNPGTITEPVAGGFERRLPPLRVDCSYLVTAWNGTQVDKIKSEHQLLGQAFFWLSRFPTIPDTYFSGSLIGQPFPPPTMVAQWDGAKNNGEFWNALGIPPRPYFTLVVTIAMDLEQLSQEYMVTNTITSYQQREHLNTAEVLIQIGGHVFNKSGNTTIEVPDAWVGIETIAGDFRQTTKTNALGRYTFEKLRPGQYKLKARTKGFPEKEWPVDVPTPTGKYDLTFP